MAKFEFGDFIRDADGAVATTPVVSSDVSAFYEEKSVMLRLALVANPDHLAGVLNGTNKPGVLQLSLTPPQARALASTIAAAADLAERKAPESAN